MVVVTAVVGQPQFGGKAPVTTATGNGTPVSSIVVLMSLEPAKKKPGGNRKSCLLASVCQQSVPCGTTIWGLALRLIGSSSARTNSHSLEDTLITFSFRFPAQSVWAIGRRPVLQGLRGSP